MTKYCPIITIPEHVALDIVGDVHGEFDALESLLLNLGYGPVYWPKNRLLVFVGDILDRGPNSYKVFQLVKKLVNEGKALCILGNHEANILREEKKDGSGWFFGIADGNEEKYLPCYFPTEAEKKEIVAFIEQLPIAACRSDIRIVHACWSSSAIAEINACTVECKNFQEFYNCFLKTEYLTKEEQVQYLSEKQKWGAAMHDPSTPVPFLPFTAKSYLAKQMSNPVRVINSGAECNLAPDEKPFFVGGAWRMIKRYDWWKDYSENVPVVMGHYWRSPPVEISETGKSFLRVSPDLPFSADSNIAWFGLNKNVFCVDYSVGKQFMNRQKARPLGHQAKLAALRWPEKMLTFDCGITVHTEE